VKKSAMSLEQLDPQHQLSRNAVHHVNAGTQTEDGLRQGAIAGMNQITQIRGEQIPEECRRALNELADAFMAVGLAWGLEKTKNPDEILTIRRMIIEFGEVMDRHYGQN